MSADQEEPTIDALRERLDGFEQALDLCWYIDDGQTFDRCRALNQGHITRLKARIAEIEAKQQQGSAA